MAFYGLGILDLIASEFKSGICKPLESSPSVDSGNENVSSPSPSLDSAQKDSGSDELNLSFADTIYFRTDVHP